MSHTEPQLFEIFTRLATIYSEGYPDDQDSIERFLRWAHLQYGYQYEQSIKSR
jgi:hypothetical protein